MLVFKRRPGEKGKSAEERNIRKILEKTRKGKEEERQSMALLSLYLTNFNSRSAGVNKALGVTGTFHIFSH